MDWNDDDDDDAFVGNLHLLIQIKYEIIQYEFRSVSLISIELFVCSSKWHKIYTNQIYQ